MKTLAQKLLVKEGRRLLVVNPPPGYEERLGPLPAGAVLLKEEHSPLDIIQVFTANRQELEAQVPRLKPLLKPGGILWVTYPKGASAVKTDINRDSIWAYARTIGMEAVALVAVDDTWSAMRLKVI